MNVVTFTTNFYNDDDAQALLPGMLSRLPRKALGVTIFMDAGHKRQSPRRQSLSKRRMGHIAKRIVS